MIRAALLVILTVSLPATAQDLYRVPSLSKLPTLPSSTSSMDGPALYNDAGEYRGRLSANPYAKDSISNPYGRYGSEYSADSINNPYGAGNPYKLDSPNNPTGSGWKIVEEAPAAELKPWERDWIFVDGPDPGWIEQ